MQQAGRADSGGGTRARRTSLAGDAFVWPPNTLFFFVCVWADLGLLQASLGGSGG